MLRIGSRRELFVDDWLIERFAGTELRLHSPTPQEVVLPFDAAWEGAVSFYVTILEVEGEYRAYYRGQKDEKSGDVTAVATSSDGITWQRPNLGLIEWEDSRENNIVWDGPCAQNFTPFEDTNPAASPSQRFKAVGSKKVNNERLLMAFVSEDGYRWQLLQSEAIITDGWFDSQNLAYWDAYRGHYVAFYRDFSNPEGEVERRSRIRGIKWATSPDFINWTPGQWFEYGDAPLEHFYTNATISYFRAPHIYLGFPKRFLPKRKVVSEHPSPGVSDGVFMSSRDGLHWDRTFMEAFLRPGRDWENWTERNNAIAWGVIPTATDELSIYWVEHYRHDTCRLRRGTLRLDGFASVNAPYEGGEVVTHPLRFEGSELALNYATSAAGSVRVELQEADGTPIEGYTLADCVEMVGDEIEGVVGWQGGTSVASLADRPVRLRMVLRDADVYALRFRL